MRIPAPAGFPGLEDLLGTTSDDSKDRCASLLRALTDLYLQRPVHTLEDDHYYTELALRLIDSADVSERATLAARLAACPSAPLPVLKRLARDTIEVAGPILQHLPHLRTAEFESPTAADTRAYWQIIASGLQRTQPAARRSHHAHPVGCAGAPADPDQSRICTVHPDPIVSVDRTHGYLASGGGRAPQGGDAHT